MAERGQDTGQRGSETGQKTVPFTQKRKDASPPPLCHSAETRFPPGGRQPTPLPPWRVGRLREQVSSRQIFEPVCRLTLSPVDLSWGCRREAAKGSPGEGWPRAWGTEVAVTGMGGTEGPSEAATSSLTEQDSGKSTGGGEQATGRELVPPSTMPEASGSLGNSSLVGPLNQ